MTVASPSAGAAQSSSQDRRATHALAALALVGVVVAVHALIDARNFSGWDEWLYLDLTSRGVASFPHSNRPLALAGVMLAPWLAAGAFDGFHLLHAAYMAGTGIATFALARRLLGGTLLPWCGAILGALWAPADPLRLATVLTSVAMSASCATASALALFVASWQRGSRFLLAAASLLALATVRCYEPTAIPLAGAPVALLALGEREGASRITWTAIFGTTLALGVVLALLRPHDALAGQLYQDAASLEVGLSGVLGRLLAQLRASVAPAFVWPPVHAATAAVAWAPLVALAAGVLLGLREKEPVVDGWRHPAWAAGVGACWLVLGLLPFTLSAVFEPGVRGSFLSGPGIGLTFASLLALASLRMGRTLRSVLAIAATGWLVFVVAARTTALQSQWETNSVWPRQRALLAQLVTAAPELERGTMLLLVDGSGAFQSTFAFRHAVAYLYGGNAIGWVARAGDGDLFYPTTFGPDGVHADVWPMHRRAWGEQPQFYGYRTLVVIEVGRHGTLRLLDRWSDALPPLPAGAAYRPAERVRGDVASARARALLGRR